MTAADTPVVPAARAARPADASRLAALAELARAEIAQQRGGALFNRREGRGEDPTTRDTVDAETWVGTLAEVVVGYAAARIEELDGGVRLGIIAALFVEPDARAVGVGECLVRAVLEWCAARGCDGVDAPALPGNRAAKNFFEESRFTARLLIMHRHLAPPGSHA